MNLLNLWDQYVDGLITLDELLDALYKANIHGSISDRGNGLPRLTAYDYNRQIWINLG